MRAPSHVVTYVLSDVEGSTQLWDRAPDAMRVALDRHDQIITTVAALHTGRVVSERGEGDSSFAVFARAADAVAYAIEVQHAMSQEPWPTPSPLRIRIGIHTGSPGDAYIEPGANACARIRDLAVGGQVLVSGSTASRVRGVLPTHAILRDLGQHRLRGLAAAEQIYQAIHPSLPDGFPALRSLSIIPNNLPAPLTSFIGRAREIDRVRAALRDHRLVTLLGTGGAGKTRLALEAAEAALGDFIDGAWLVELLSALPGEPIEHLVAGAVGVRAEHARDALTAAATRIGRSETLLVMDNCEHVVEHAAHAVTALLKACPNLRVLATSRELLRTPGEAVVEVEPLAAPDADAAPDTIGTFDAVRLFVERARLHRPDLRLDEDTSAHVSSICRRLDGLPLAVELAAARARLLSLADIDARLDQHAGRGPRGTPEHHQTIEASIAWSVDQLSDQERALFLRLSVFAGGWTIEQAEAVCGFEPFTPDDIAPVLGALSDRSLVSVQQEGEESRFRMLETVRAFASRALDPDGRLAAQRALFEYFSGLSRRAREHLDGPAQAMWLDRLARDDANLNAALHHGIERDPHEGLVLASRLAPYWDRRGRVREGLRWLSRMIESAGPEPTAALAAARVDAGYLAMLAGEPARAHEELTRALQIAGVCGANAVRENALTSLGHLHHSEGDYPAARAAYDDLLALARERGDGTGEALVLGNLGNVAHSERDFGTARTLYQKALAAERALGNERGVAGSLLRLSSVAVAQRDYAAAQAFAIEGLEIAQALGDPRLKGMLLTQQASVLVEQGDLVNARAVYLEALAERREVEDAPGVAVVTLYLGELDFLSGDHTDAWKRATESLASFRSFGMRLAEASVLNLMADIEAARGRHDDAAERFREAMFLASGLGDRQLVAQAIEGLATAAAGRATWVRATELIGVAAQIRRSLGVPMPPSRRNAWDKLTDTVRRTLGTETFDAVIERAGRLDPDAALSLATEA